jgi:predicted kinase
VGQRPECVILIGLPGAGKSTLARRRFPAHDYISKDAFAPSARDKQAQQNARLRAALAAGRSAVVDNTNVTPADRAAIIAVARELGASVTGVYVEASRRSRGTSGGPAAPRCRRSPSSRAPDGSCLPWPTRASTRWKP